MKNWIKTTVVALLSAGVVQGAVPTELNSTEDKASYAIGANLGKGLRRDSVSVNVDLLIQGLQDAFAGKDLPLDDQAISSSIRAHWEATRQKAGEENIAKGKAFLAENAKRANVVALPSGLQYEVIEQGKGNSPSSNDVVTVHYRGTLIDGTEFDSSHKRGRPAEFRVNQVIRGWTEALQLMKAGSKWNVFIPSDLAYGAKGSGRTIPPNATLQFEVELISFKAPPPPPPVPTSASQAVTSDIIKVPSKAEMEKGAQIEIIKKEDVPKLIEEQKKKDQNEE